ncbi:MAG: hypothetical protein JO200_03420, partial [Comamonas sp.]|nr:hypothetical protein [Comamonas sp.]
MNISKNAKGHAMACEKTRPSLPPSRSAIALAILGLSGLQTAVQAQEAAESAMPELVVTAVHDHSP